MDWAAGPVDANTGLRDHNQGALRVSDQREAQLESFFTRKWVTKSWNDIQGGPNAKAELSKAIYDGVRDSGDIVIASMWADAVRGMVDHSIAAAAASRRGDSLAMGGEILQSVSSFIGIAGTVGGPLTLVASSAIGALLGIVSSILAACDEPPKSIDQILAKVIESEDAKTMARKLRSTTGAFAAVRRDLQAMDAGRHQFNELLEVENFLTGDGAFRLRDGTDWLKTPESQELPEWDLVFHAYFEAVRQHTMNMAIATTMLVPYEVTKENPTLHVSESAVRMFTAIWGLMQELDSLCAALVPAIENRGPIWYIGGNRRLYARDHLYGEGGNFNDGSYIGGESEFLAVSQKSRRLWTIEAGDQQWGRDHNGAVVSDAQVDYGTFNATTGNLWTGFAGDFKKVASATHVSVLPVEPGAERVFIIDGGVAKSRVWMDGQDDDGKWIGDWKGDWQAIAPSAGSLLLQVSAVTIKPVDTDPAVTPTPFSRIYLLGPDRALHWGNYPTESDPVWRFYTVCGTAQLPPFIKGITTSSSELIAFGHNTIWRLPHADVNREDATWTMLEMATSFCPADTSWCYDDVFACEDRSVIALANLTNEWSGVQRKFLFITESTGEWREVVSHGTGAVKAFRQPLEAESLFSAVWQVTALNLKKFCDPAFAPQYDDLRAAADKKGLIVRDASGKITGISGDGVSG
jgi:hypothetical protein